MEASTTALENGTALLKPKCSLGKPDRELVEDMVRIQHGREASAWTREAFRRVPAWTPPRSSAS